MGFEIVCPNCGRRSYREYWFGGEARPYSMEANIDENFENTWFRENLAGPQIERWFHFAGCRRWLAVERDTRTNTIVHDGTELP